MRIQHKVNHGWAPNRNDPEWEERVEREAASTTEATEKAWRRAQDRLAKAEARRDRLVAERAAEQRLRNAEQIIMLRLAELKEIEKLMTRSPAGARHRGRKSFRPVPGNRSAM